jgi:prolyl oligopeptidase
MPAHPPCDTSRRPRFLGTFVALVSLAACGSQPPPPAAPPAPPPPAPAPLASAAASAKPLPVPTPREPTGFELHGARIEDPYLWLENEPSDRVREWSRAQNALTRSTLDAIAERAAIKSRIEKLMGIGAIGLPRPKKLTTFGWRYFYTRRMGMQNQPVLYRREGHDGADKVVVDVNALAADGTASLDWYFPSNDGRLVAYGVSRNGDEDSTLHVREATAVEGTPDLKDAIEHTRHGSVAWKPDGTGFLYTRYPRDGEFPKEEMKYHRRIFEHRLGDDPAKDKLVFGDGRAMTDSPSPMLSPDGRWLLVEVFQGWSKSELYLRDLQAKAGAFVPVATGKEATYYAQIVDDGWIFVHTNDSAPRGRIVRVDPHRPQRDAWKVVVPESDDPIEDMHVVGGEIVVTYLHDVATRVLRFTREGRALGQVPLPGLGSASVSGAWNGQEAFVSFTTFTVPNDVLRLPVSVKTKTAPEPWQRLESPLEASKYEVAQRWTKSKDGTRVPYFVVRARDVAEDGRAPGVVSAYGGFNIAERPSYLNAAGVLIERGGVWVEANLRGGGEYGEAWHRAGMLEAKQNVFDDLFAVIGQLVRDKTVAPDRVGLTGGSNGGLLVGAALTQHPELLRAAVARAPLMDMLRYHNYLIAKLWVPEYGSPEDPKMFPVLRAYSPYHAVREGISYPATLVTAAESDARVDPMHARKMVAALQWATASREPALLRLESKAGHGAGKPLGKRVEENADVFAFLLWKLGMAK